MTTPFPGKTYMSLRRYERDKSGGKKKAKTVNLKQMNEQMNKKPVTEFPLIVQNNSE